MNVLHAPSGIRAGTASRLANELGEQLLKVRCIGIEEALANARINDISIYKVIDYGRHRWHSAESIKQAFGRRGNVRLTSGLRRRI